MSINWKKGVKAVAGGFVDILEGKFFQRMRAEKYLPQIVYTFLLFGMMILFTLAVDRTLTKVEVNKETLKRLNVEHTQKEYELIMLNRQSTVADILQSEGSELGSPEKAATVLR